jgi:hypothetical protein
MPGGGEVRRLEGKKRKDRGGEAKAGRKTGERPIGVKA